MAHILLVDDDESFRRMLRLMLNRLGHQVVEAQNGKEAWALFRSNPAELVILDLIMPEQEGLETIQLLRENSANTKILAVSGGGRLNAGDLLKFAGLFGADYVLAKPFSKDELVIALDGLLAPAPQGGSLGRGGSGSTDGA